MEEEEIDKRADELTMKRVATNNVDGRKRFKLHKVNHMAAAKTEKNKKLVRAPEAKVQ